MNHINHNLFSVFYLLLFLWSGALFAQKVHYHISFPAPHTHYVRVKMDISDIPVGEDTLRITMPVWAPGSYLIREFARHVENVQVQSKEQHLFWTKINKNTWQIAAKDLQPFTFSYDVYAFEHSVRTSFIDASHASIIPTSVFMYVESAKDQPATLTIEPYKEWKKISTSLEQNQNGVFQIPNYDILADSPIEIGNQDVFEFDAAGVKHYVVMYGQATYEPEQIKTDLAKIITSATRVFGENPAKNYHFIIHNMSYGGGGLEHLNSTNLIVNRHAYQSPRGYLGFLGLAAHEYFHLWNVKRLRPFELTAYDYTQEQYTRLLWVFEGFTSYYDELLLHRAGFTSQDEYLSTLEKNISGVENRQGRHVQAVSDASFDAWIKAYRPHENSSNTTVSYYSAGSVYGAMLDLIILHHTNGEKSLDDLMRYLYEEYYKKQGRGFTEQEFIGATERIAGTNLDSFFDDYVYGTKPLDYNEYLMYAGLELKVLANTQTATLGINTSTDGGKLIIRHVERNGAAYHQGLNVNDEIIAIDNMRVSSDGEIQQLLQHKNVGDEVTVLISRDDILQTFKIKLQAPSAKSYQIKRLENPSQMQTRILAKWLKEDKE